MVLINLLYMFASIMIVSQFVHYCVVSHYLVDEIDRCG